MCVVRSEAGGAVPGAHPATAVAGANGVAVAYGLNYVSGDVGAVLVGAYTDVNNKFQMAHARVGDPGIAPFVRYSVNQAGAFVAVPDARDGGAN
ncbi:MAG: hypothetical protein K8T90_21610 [Planctomycetes bacterium]|nr:hypothetical protein [Planctomycetota bacterium]